jgi:cytochrome b6-f complex iron-sulfur subunit
MNTSSTYATHDPIPRIRRRRFLKYMAGSTAAMTVLGYLLPVESVEPSLEDLCSSSPFNSRCKDYLPGVQAKNEDGQPIQADHLLSTARPRTRIAAKGLEKSQTTYLVITDPPRIAEYAINPTCTHLGCTVDWKADQNEFVCPCHGLRYDSQGRVVHRPAQRNLGLITVILKQNQIRLVGRSPVIDPRIKAP